MIGHQGAVIPGFIFIFTENSQMQRLTFGLSALLYLASSLAAVQDGNGGHARILSNGVAVPGDFPVITTRQYGPTAPGRLFFSSTFFTDNSQGNYIVICENDGTPYFYRRIFRSPRSDKGTADFRVQANGLLSLHHYLEVESGTFYVLNTHFEFVDTFQCSPPLRTDNHEFLLLENGHALLIGEEDLRMDMSQLIPGQNRFAQVIDNCYQEIDSDGHVYWEWKGLDHLDIRDAFEVNVNAFNIDYLHLNSIAPDYDGNYIVSLRSFSEVAKIDRGTGEFIWRFQGKNNQFTLINEDTPISAQHHARPVPGKPNHYTIYDNGNSRQPPYTRAVEYKLDPVKMTAEKVWEYRYNQVNFSSMMGSVQRFGNGNTYIDWSAWPPMRACEIDSDNNLLFEIEVSGISGYRSYRFDWEGRALKPDLIVESNSDGVSLIMNQFNDPEVDYYKIYHGKQPHPATLLDTSRLTLKRITNLENRQMHYFRVTSVSRSGTESGYSNEESVFIKVIAPGENQLLNADFSSGDTFWNIEETGFFSATGVVIDGAFCLTAIATGPFGTAALVQDQIALVRDETYIFEFDAWANETIQMQPAVRSFTGNTDYSRIGSIQVSRDPEHFVFEFKKSANSTSEARVYFTVDRTVQELYLDNISIRQKLNPEGLKRKWLQDLFRLDDNFPNPFNDATTFQFYLPSASEVRLTLFDLLGREVRTIIKESFDQGIHRIRFQDPALSSGIYFYRLEAGYSGSAFIFTDIKKLIYLK